MTTLSHQSIETILNLIWNIDEITKVEVRTKKKTHVGSIESVYADRVYLHVSDDRPPMLIAFSLITGVTWAP